MSRLVFGASVRRVEDPPLLRGEGRYVDDLQPSDCLHAVFLRSHLAHALIRSIDIEAASKATGVVAVWSAPDFIDLEPLEIASAVDGMTIPERRVLASGRVRHVGEALAMLIAESVAQARDALELVELDLDPLPAVTDVERALQEGAQLLYPEFGTNLAFQNASRHGPVKRSFDRAQVIVRERLLNQRLIPSALEPRGALAWLDDERLTLQISSQSTFGVREAVAASLGIDEKDLRVIVRDVGGGFGSKGGCLGEEIAVAAAARRLRRPVKWIEERWENCAVTWHGRGQLQEVELAAQRDGTVLAIRSRIVADMGAHLEPYSAFVPTVTPDLQTGCYRIPASQNTIQGVYTNKAPTGPYRGAGRGDYSGALGRLVEVSEYQRLRELQAKARAEGQLHGIGVATYVEVAAGEPADRATARLETDGTITIVTGSTPHGQGHQTTWAQIAADIFGVPLDRITVAYGDSDLPAYAVGTFGSRSAAVSGAAARQSALELTARLRALAGAAFEAAVPDIALEDGRVQVRGVPTRAMSLSELASWAKEAGRESELSVEAEFDPPDNVFPFGAHLAYLEVDRETGAVKLLRYIAVDDCGTVINPTIVDGQVHGAIAQGLAQALLEGAVYDEDGQLVTGNLTTYLLPTAADLLPFETHHTVTPTPHNPMGVKGIGEGGTIAATPAVANAVMDALRPLGIHNLEMPLTPWRIWEAIRERS